MDFDTARPSDASVKATREDWINVALQTLITEGVDKVKVLPLGNKLEVSRSSFYWYFRNRDDLLDTLLDYWDAKNTRNLIAHCEIQSPSIVIGALLIAKCWLHEDLFDPRLDFAIREWSRRDPEVRRRVDAADKARVQAMTGVFKRHGYEDVEAYIRARVFYFTQIGYYALDLGEQVEERLSYLSAYIMTATGVAPDARILEGFSDRDWTNRWTAGS